MKTKKKLAELIRLDAAVHFATCATIKTKDARVVTGPVPNILQKRCFDHYRQCQIKQKACKIIILKPRQTGASTVAQHLIYFHNQRYPETNAATMGDIAGTSDKVFDIYRRFAQFDPYDWSSGRVNLGTDQADDITLWNGSSYAKTTAGSKNAGRSGTIQAGNLTEPAFYKTEGGSDPTLAFLNSAYDGGPECFYIADSTPNGPQGWFYDTCMAALKGITDWHLVFAAWFEFEEHSRRFHSREERDTFEETLTEDEMAEMERYGCTLEQMHWRRYTIADKCGGEVAKFRQEYPSDIHECFLLSSRPRFHRGQIDKHRKGAKELNPGKVNFAHQSDGVVTMLPDRAGQWDVYEEPKYECAYLCGVDLSTGEDQQLEQGLAPDPDWHSAQIWRAGYYDVHDIWHLPRLVAEHHSRLEVAYLTAEVAAASAYYGNCLIVPEVNGPGLAMVKLLREIYPGTHLYQRRRVNDSTGMVEKAFGWSTDALTRKTIIDYMAKCVVDDDIDIPSLGLLDEMMVFIVNSKGKPEAAPKMHDDRVLAAAISLFNLRSARTYHAPKRTLLKTAMLEKNPGLACPDGFTRIPLGEIKKRNSRPRRSYSRS
jgi:hypothetical protein